MKFSSRILVVLTIISNFYIVSLAQTTSLGSDPVPVTTAPYGVYIGDGAGQPYFTNSLSNTLVGYKVGINGSATATRSNNIFIGREAGINLQTYSSSISYNIIMGYWAANGADCGNYNSIIGYGAAYHSTFDDDYNVLLGMLSGASAQIGNGNVFLGSRTGSSALGYGNGMIEKSIFLGYESGMSSQTKKSVFIGYESGYHSEGENNLFIGNGAGSGLVVSNKLIIDNDVNGSDPLIEGDFSNKYFTINGKIGVNNETPEADLDVVGTIKAQEIQVTLASMEDLHLNGTLAANNITYTANGQTADHVFEENYNLKSLDEIESFIKKNKHLPDVPSAAEMEEKGVDLAEMNKLLLQKVEELTLYAIEKDKEVENQKQKVKSMEERLNVIETALQKIVEL